MAFSNWMKAPVMMSCTSFCAPKPTARPTTPAPASKGAMFTPMAERVSMAVITTTTTVKALRSSDRSVEVRAETTRPPVGLSLYSIQDETPSQISPAKSRISVADRPACTAARPVSPESQPRKSKTPQLSPTMPTTTINTITRRALITFGAIAFSRGSSMGRRARVGSGRRRPPAMLRAIRIMARVPASTTSAERSVAPSMKPRESAGRDHQTSTSPAT